MAKERTDVPELLHMRDMDDGLDFLREALGRPWAFRCTGSWRPRLGPGRRRVRRTDF